MPSVNVKETKTHYEIEMAVPGLKKEDFKINIDRNILTISSESQTENEERDEKKKTTPEENLIINHSPVHLPCLLIL